MYSITKWYSFDEEEFDTKEACEAYESDIQDMLSGAF